MVSLGAKKKVSSLEFDNWLLDGSSMYRKRDSSGHRDILSLGYCFVAPFSKFSSGPAAIEELNERWKAEFPDQAAFAQVKPDAALPQENA